MIEFLWPQKANKDNLGRYYPVPTLATWCEQLTHWKSPWCWVRLKAEGEEGNRGWDGRMAWPMQQTWTWADSRRWWGTGKPGTLQSMGSQRIGHDLVTEQWQQLSCTLHILEHFEFKDLGNFSDSNSESLTFLLVLFSHRKEQCFLCPNICKILPLLQIFCPPNNQLLHSTYLYVLDKC